VVLGAGGDGELYFGGFRELIDFEDVLEENALEETALRAGEEGLSVDFARDREVLSTARDLRSVVTRLRAEVVAGNPVPEHLWEFIDDRRLRVQDGELVMGETQATDRP
jgi:hypothetical protein